MNRRSRKAARGQSIVLLAATAALLAFTLMTTLSIGKAIKERVQIQQAADASAYSEAVQEARAFNYYSYTNRAIIAHYVIMMSIYGHMSYLAYYEGVLQGMASFEQWGCNDSGWGLIMLTMLGECEGYCAVAAGCGPWCPACCDFIPKCIACNECLFVSPDEYDGIVNACDKLTTRINDLDKYLGKSQGTNSGEMNTLSQRANDHRDYGKALVDLQQEAIDVGLQAALTGVGTKSLNQQIAQQFDPQYNTPNAALIGAINTHGVLGDSHAAGYCSGVTSTLCGNGTTSLSSQQQAANASRYGPAELDPSIDWLRNRPDGMIGLISDAYLVMGNPMQDRKRIQSGMWWGTGMSREITNPGGDPTTVIESKAQGGGASGGGGGGGSYAVGGADHGELGMAVDLVCASGDGPVVGFGLPQSISTWAYSKPSCDGNSIVNYNDGTQQQVSTIGGCNGAIKGLGLPTVNFNPGCAGATCGSDGALSLFNEPRTWALVTKSFSSPSAQGPFGMNKSMTVFGGTYRYNNGITLQPGDPDYSTERGSLWGLSQGLAYYHRPGDWKEPPNFYNPYWRAKLLPLDWKPGSLGVGPATDYAEVLKAGGIPAGSAVKLAGLPITQ